MVIVFLYFNAALSLLSRQLNYLLQNYVCNIDKIIDQFLGVTAKNEVN